MKIFTFILLAVFFVLMFWMFDVRGVRVLLLQHNSETFPHVQGEILSSEVTTTRGSKGQVYYHALISYQYNVDGTDYTGYRYRYDGHPTDSASVNAVVGDHPQGSAVNVYYNPRDPADALLSPPVDTKDVATLFFVNSMVMLFFWMVVKAGRDLTWLWRNSDVAGGVKIITEMMVTRVRLPRFQPLDIGLLAGGILCVLAAAVIAFGWTSVVPWVAGEWSLAAVLLGGFAAYAWQFSNLQSGKRDLVIDEAARTIQLPLTYGRRAQTSVSFSEIRSVLMNKIRHQTKTGVYYTYMVTLQMKDDSEQKLINLNQQRATSLWEWLNGKFGFARAVTEASQP